MNGRCLIPVLALVLCCSAPLYYDRAEIQPGLSTGLGVGLTTGEQGSGESQSTHWPEYDYCRAFVGSLYLHYKSPDRPAAFFFQANGGQGTWLTGSSSSQAYLVDVQAGAKFRLGDSVALRLGVGIPSLVDAVLLIDMSRYVTAGIGAGFRGFSLSLALHPLRFWRLAGHLSLNGVLTPWHQGRETPLCSGGAAVGVEVVDWSNLGAGSTALLRSTAQVGGFSAGAALSVALAMAPGVLVAPAVGAGSTWLVGNWCYPRGNRGSFLWTVAGSYAGALVGGGMGGLVAWRIGSQSPVFIGAVALAPTGALLAYHMSRPKEAGNHSNNWLELPSLAVRPGRLPDRSELTVYDARLVTVRF